ncbi:hypothetical protein FACS189485_00420 [Spirochaetia bacterium]|nr:hypothetical protein FACS189485_00420 [Spirochaetia bacterium]
MSRRPAPFSAALSAALLAGILFLGSCATAPRVPPLGPDSLGIEYLPLDPGAQVYVFADVDAGRPILNRVSLGGIADGQAAGILDRTQYAVLALYPPAPSAGAEVPRTMQAAAWGKYPGAGAGFYFAFSKDWKKKKSVVGKSYWYSAQNGLAVALNSRQAFVAIGEGAAAGQNNAADSKNPLDPFAASPGTPSPEGFTEFRRGAALTLWLENPSAILNRFLDGMNLPLQIPAEELLIGLYPAPSAEFAAKLSAGKQTSENGLANYEAILRIKTPSVSQARALVTIFSMARLFAANAAGAGGIAAPSMAALAPILFANPPEQDGAFLNIRTALIDESEIALLFSLFSVYSIQN